VNRSKFTGKEVLVERQPKFKPYIMGMQVSFYMGAYESVTIIVLDFVGNEGIV
jgi:hypothetical protein